MLSAWFVEGVSYESELPGGMVVTHTRDRSKASSTQGLLAMKMNRARTAGGGDVNHPYSGGAEVVPDRAASGVGQHVGTRTGAPARLLSRGETSWSGTREGEDVMQEPDDRGLAMSGTWTAVLRKSFSAVLPSGVPMSTARSSAWKETELGFWRW